MHKLTAITAQIGDIWLYANDGGVFGNLIEKEQRKRGYGEFSKFCHAELSLGGYSTVYTQPPLSTMEDVRIVHPVREAMLLRLTYPDLSVQRGKMVEGIFDVIHTAYDWLGVAKFVIDILPEDPRAYFCSKGVAFTIQRIYPQYPSGLCFGNVCPAALAANREGKLLPDVSIIWSGKIPTLTEGV
jgi:hypothetical protein